MKKLWREFWISLSFCNIILKTINGEANQEENNEGVNKANLKTRLEWWTKPMDQQWKPAI